MSKSKSKIFVYGTLKRGQPNNKLMEEIFDGEVTYMGKGLTGKAYPLVIAAASWNLPCMLSVEGTGKKVHGELFEVDEEMLSFLDGFEGHPDFYRRKQIIIQLTEDHNGRKLDPPNIHTCWCYFFLTYDRSYLTMPFLDNYDSWGPHGLMYDEQEREDNSNETKATMNS
ncbi:gamma-glutamylaminecyclotransferase-like [Pecten maximus]|uniref:gamma-glutamylaminecyclotransferase-like n=1 Tax=Pecten maximus TaxID=6579 RepID=UPI00145861E6|nr:gamma-glutamylaminecyclotransferase-like [Pecten maximus]XP_033733182.1 gamma-glutamylaminecyclotransferase-like [Pecten maximus]XP_033733183.1 gamma-glutamylaminecyclotransferase-like [Pecten maximus]